MVCARGLVATAEQAEGLSWPWRGGHRWNSPIPFLRLGSDPHVWYWHWAMSQSHAPVQTPRDGTLS